MFVKHDYSRSQLVWYDRKAYHVYHCVNSRIDFDCRLVLVKQIMRRLDSSLMLRLILVKTF